jgi:FkbM family methyltransferase
MKTTSSIYFQPRNLLQSWYYDVRLKQPKEFNFLQSIENIPDFLGRYVLMNPINSALHPFQFVKPGDTVVHVGFDRVYLNKGLSHPLILAALVGKNGRVLAIDPDRRNAEALRSYVERNNISNLIVIEGAAWKEPATLEFVFDGIWSPMSTASDILENSKNSENYIPGENSIKSKVQAFTLDYLVKQHLPGREITYLNLTANGAEPEILQGATCLLVSGPDLRIGIALSYHHFSYAIRKAVCEDLAKKGFRIAVADAPHDPWLPYPFFFACASNLSHEGLAALGFNPSSWELIEKGAAAKEAKLISIEKHNSKRQTKGLMKRGSSKLIRMAQSGLKHLQERIEGGTAE